MNNILKDIKDVHGELCVSIIMNTHHTYPDNERDPILLKNLHREAVERLLKEPNKKLAKQLVERLDKLVEKIDHRRNTQSLVIFVNELVAEYAHLSVEVTDRVVIDTTFATRDLVRSLHAQKAYYTLVLGQDRARLIEAANGRVVEEIGRPFPLTNSALFASNRTAGSNAARLENFQKEFFNRVDKALWAVWHEHPLPVVLSADEKSIAYFKKVSEHNNVIIGEFNDIFSKPAQHLIEANWHIVEEYARKMNEARLVELKEALDTGKFLTDINEIWDAIQEGKGKTLFVKNGYFQPAEIIDGIIHLVDLENAHHHGVIDDIVDEMVEINANFGGDTVFIYEGGLEQFNGLALTTRW